MVAVNRWVQELKLGEDLVARLRRLERLVTFLLWRGRSSPHENQGLSRETNPAIP